MICDLLSELSRQFKAGLRKAAGMVEVRLTPALGEVLACLGRNPEANLSMLSDYTGRDKGQITRMVADLESLGLIVRERPASDRRFVRLRLTPRGSDLYQHVLARRSELSAIMLQNLTAKEHRLLLDLLVRMRSSLHTQEHGLDPLQDVD